MHDRNFSDEDRQSVIDVVTAAGDEGALISDVVAHAAKTMPERRAKMLVRQILDLNLIHTTRTFRLRDGSGFENHQPNGGKNGQTE